jgi:Integrase core domain
VTLKALCPQMARRELQDLLRRYRRVWRHRQRLVARVLHWKRPGTVWAIDFSEPPTPVDGTYPYALAVRDLASGFQLLWLPTEHASAEAALAALRSLFRSQGKPLVLKTDNGSSFVAEAFQSYLSRHQVWQLFSPPAWPAYNGSCEAGIGSMRTRTHHQSVRRGLAGQWTCDDMEAARLQANELARPWGLTGPPPAQIWQSRKVLCRQEREKFARTVQSYIRKPDKSGGRLKDEAAVRREALVHALVQHGLLEFTATSVPQPYPPRRRKGRTP